MKFPCSSGGIGYLPCPAHQRMPAARSPDSCGECSKRLSLSGFETEMDLIDSTDMHHHPIPELIVEKPGQLWMEFIRSEVGNCQEG